MIGSDWPVCLSRGSWSTAMSVVLDAIADSGPDAIELVGGQTARTAFRLQTSCLSPSTMGTSS
jgi:predicted TIM-barrel fold metal-dependent hydrolase